MGRYLQLQHSKVINNVLCGCLRYWYIVVRWSKFWVLNSLIINATHFIQPKIEGFYAFLRLPNVYLLTPWCMSPSWEANWFAASQEIPRISRNPNVHYSTHKRPPHVSILVPCTIRTVNTTVHSRSQDHHPSKNSVQKTICGNSTSNAPDDGRMHPKHVELRIHQYNYLVASSRHFTLFHDSCAI